MPYLPAALIVIITSGACSYIEPDDQAMHAAAHEFVAAVERGDPESAATWLTRDARSKISVERFSEAPGDVKPVVDAFRKAAINTRNRRPRDEPALYVEKFGGRAGTIVVVMVREDGQWKVANILDWADARSREP